MPTATPVVRDATTGLLRNLQAGEQLAASVAFGDTRTAQNGEAATALTGGMPVYISSTSKILRAVASSVGTGKVAGLVYDAAIAASASGAYIVSGTLSQATALWDAVTGQTGGLTPGQDYFVDPSTPGRLTTTPPTATGSVISKVGTAQSATDMEVAPRDPFLN